MARKKTIWKKGKIHRRRVGKAKVYERGRWEYPNGKKKGRRWRKVR